MNSKKIPDLYITGTYETRTNSNNAFIYVKTILTPMAVFFDEQDNKKYVYRVYSRDYTNPNYIGPYFESSSKDMPYYFSDEPVEGNQLSLVPSDLIIKKPVQNVEMIDESAIDGLLD